MFSKFLNFLAATLACSAIFQPVLGFSRPENNTAFPRNIIYVQTFNDSSGAFYNLTDLITDHTNVTHVILATLHLNSKSITLNDNDINSNFWDPLWPMVSSLQTAGVKVMLRMGGNSDNSWSVLQNNFNSTYSSILKILKKHTLDGFDIDVSENVSQDTIVQLVQRLDSDLGTDFIITGSPGASDLEESDAKDYVSWAAIDGNATSSTRPNGKLFNWFNIEIYDGWLASQSTQPFDSIVSNGWDPRRVVLGALTATNVEDPDFVDLKAVLYGISVLKKTYPTFGGVAGWEYGPDPDGANNGETQNKWVAAIGQALFS